jgi:NADPH-dependent 2,4-dienoyl-CoA reductase/sulfur reductase-like enzyme
MQKMKLVVVGNGMAGMRTVEELLKIAPDLYDITVFGDESYPNYNRIIVESGMRRTTSGFTPMRASTRSTARTAWSTPGMAPARNMTAYCSPPVPGLSCCRFRAPTSTA